MNSREAYEKAADQAIREREIGKHDKNLYMVMLAAVTRGPDPQTIFDDLGGAVALDEIQRFVTKMKDSEIINEDGMLDVLWLDENSGQVAFWCDFGVMQGNLVRVRSGRSWAYKTTSRAALELERAAAIEKRRK